MGGKAKVTSNKKRIAENLLDITEILEATSFDPATLVGLSLPPGFTKCDDKKAGKVSPFSKEKKSGAFTYDYPKGSPFKMVTKPKSHGEGMYKDLVEANKRGMVNWNQVKFTQATLKHLQKRLEMLDA